MTVMEAAPLEVAVTRTPLRDFVRALRRQPLMAVGLAIIVAAVLLALFAPLITPYPADAGNATHPVNSLAAPGDGHILGTDQLGRDVFTRVIYGARTSLLIVIGVLVLAALVGVPLGIVAGATGGWVDDVIMRITDVFLAFPALLLALALATVLTPSAEHAALAIAITWWPWYARLARGSAAAIAGAATSRRRGRWASRARACWPATCCRTPCRRSSCSCPWTPRGSCSPRRRCRSWAWARRTRRRSGA
jgi:peptide/nickel transport system permease protein